MIKNNELAISCVDYGKENAVLKCYKIIIKHVVF